MLIAIHRTEMIILGKFKRTEEFYRLKGLEFVIDEPAVSHYKLGAADHSSVE